MKRKIKFKQLLSGVMAVMTILTTTLSQIPAFAAEPENKVEYPTYEEVKDQLDADEVVTAKDLELEIGSVFDVICDYTGLEIPDDTKVNVIFHEAKNQKGEDFSTSHADSYQAVYYVEPVGGHPTYQIHRELLVKEPMMEKATENTTTESQSSEPSETEESEESESESQEESTSGEIDPGIESEIETETETETEAELVDDMVTEEPAPETETETMEDEPATENADKKYNLAQMTDDEICTAAEKLIQEHIAAGEYELKFEGEELDLFMSYQNILNFGRRDANQGGSMLRAATGSLIVKNAKNGTGMWDLPLLDYIYSSELGNQVHNYVKYIADDAANGWRFAYCTQVSKHFIDSTTYIGKTWEQNGMYSEISYAIAHGCSIYTDL